ncbi:hypothetical protein AB0D11_49135, partial [Streptomyces monashensis]
MSEGQSLRALCPTLGGDATPPASPPPTPLAGASFLLLKRSEDLLQTALAKTYVAWDRIEDQRALDGYVRRA